jgi:hypothetical protein
MQEPGQSLTSLGTISGRVQPIETGNDDCFRLYVPLFEAFVDCFIEAALVDVVRGMEGEYVIVAGLLARSPVTGRPITVQNVFSIERVTPDAPGSYRRARGAVPWRPGNLLPEDAIRRIRDESVPAYE